LFKREVFTQVAIPEGVFEQTSVTYAVQVCGKLRGEFEVSANANDDEIIDAAKKRLGDRLSGEIVKTIVVPKKLVNFVIR
ncbi:MAG: hypothetical protein LBN32_01800, partial [Helicobacteraceae bacterium]|nr:hypothetical protein [Helicobacteraceae bacterium]